MDPQQEKPQQQHLRPDKIISMMRVTKKTDVLFKPLKKLKTALQSIGYDKISVTPTKTIILFHFGLGNDLDLQFLKLVKVPPKIVESNPILPGKSYCYLRFQDAQQAKDYLSLNFANILPDTLAGYREVTFQNLTRVLICMFAKQILGGEKQEILGIDDTPEHYVEDSIPGIKLIQNFISKQQELELLQNIDKGEWSKLNNRRVQHFGYEFKYGRNQIDKEQQFEKPIPQYMHYILKRLCQNEYLPKIMFDQMTINDYFSGDGIPSHFDTHSPFQQYFVAISMLSGLVMDWKKYDGTEKTVYLHPRSLIIFSGEGRYAWTHGIACRKLDRVSGQLKYRSRRISITLRKIKFTPCTCPYYFYCDSQGYDQSTMKKSNPLLLKYLAETVNNKKLIEKSASQIYQTYVLDAYKGFGFDFHNRAIKTVQNMIQHYMTKREQLDFITILDVGCGNGQYKEVIEQIKIKPFHFYCGIQICQSMKKFDDKILMNGIFLGFRDNSFNLVLCVAVLHHLTTQNQRLKMLRQMRRVADDEAAIIISVFGYQQKQNIYVNQDILLDYCLPQQKAKKAQQECVIKEQELKKQKRGYVYKRYYHLFKEEQIKDLCIKAGLLCQACQKDKQNIILYCKKIKQTID